KLNLDTKIHSIDEKLDFIELLLLVDRCLKLDSDFTFSSKSIVIPPAYQTGPSLLPMVPISIKIPFLPNLPIYLLISNLIFYSIDTFYY
ncbi:MAG TPA: hypothetical protein VIQ04_04040, partial [Nitrososphaeraceae archaeon]